jgi:RHS repeat-associated protein
VTSVTTPDSAVVTTSYSSNTVTVTDQAGKTRKSVTDALGRLTAVYEDPAGLNYQTSYSYDVLDNLTSVSQGVQTRTFVYDSVKRLTSATNPESGAVTYGYDANGNLTTRIDARSITTTLAYDALNRVTSKSYNDSPQTPIVSYFYDSQSLPSGAPSFDRGYSAGRLVAVTYGSGSSAGTYRGYDQLGRVVRQYQRTDSVNYLVEATYFANSAVQSETYPAVPGASDRRVISYTNDAAGRLSSLSSSATSYAPAASVSAIGYVSHNALRTETYGNGLIHTIDYNNRLQATQIKLGTSGNPTSVISLGYSYGTTNNNGNVLTHTYSGGGLSYTQTFGYDALNRLTTASESGSAWSQTNGYDRYGNRWVDIGGGNQSLYFNTANNRITGASYDAAGNLLNDGSHTYSYDAENKIAKVDNVSAYVYDGEGQRVRKLVGENLRFVYGLGGELIAEFDASTGNLRKEYIHGGGSLITIEPTAVNSNGTRYTVSDHLGSPRVVTNSSAGVVSRHDYMPFGEQLGSGVGGRTAGIGFGVADSIRQQFTSKERDAETGLDYFGARYYSSTQGRFSGADPLFIEMKRLPYPQAWNLYTYTRNNPLKYVDDDGLEITVKCQTDEDCTKTNDDLNNRKGGQFKTKIENGKLKIVGEVDKAKLSKSEGALYNAIVSTKISATLEVVSSSDSIDFGYSALNDPKHPAGLNLIDRSDLDQLNKVDPALAGEVVAHEAMEAFGSAGGIPSYELAHVFANQFFGDLNLSTVDGVPNGAASVSSAHATLTFKRLETNVTIEKTFVTPLPRESLRNTWDRTRGNIRVVPPTQQKPIQEKKP